MLFSAVGKHRPYLRVAADLALEDDVAPIRSPGREVVAAGVVGHCSQRMLAMSIT